MCLKYLWFAGLVAQFSNSIIFTGLKLKSLDSLIYNFIKHQMLVYKLKKEIDFNICHLYLPLLSKHQYKHRSDLIKTDESVHPT